MTTNEHERFDDEPLDPSRPLPPLRAFKIRFHNPATNAEEACVYSGHALSVSEKVLIVSELVVVSGTLVPLSRYGVCNWMTFEEMFVPGSAEKVH